MMKHYKKELIVSTLLALLPIAAGLLLWNRLPGQLATHWGMHGADRWSGKAAAVFLQPLLLLAAHYLVLLFVFRDAKNRNQSKKVVGLRIPEHRFRHRPLRFPICSIRIWTISCSCFLR